LQIIWNSENEIGAVMAADNDWPREEELGDLFTEVLWISEEIKEGRRPYELYLFIILSF